MKPMLATVYDKNRAMFPCVVQPKLDGVRMTLEVRADGSIGEMKSRVGSDFSYLSNALGIIIPRHGVGSTNTPRVFLDGELYIHGMGFQKIVSLVKNRSEKSYSIEYHVYDAWIPSMPNAPLTTRLDMVNRIAEGLRSVGGRVNVVESVVADTPDVVRALLSRFLHKGYEGVMVRDPVAPYDIGKRSRSLCKLKPFEDDEFEVVGFEEASGKDKGTVVLVCITETGARFNVRPKGTHVQRSRMLRDARLMVGKRLTVRFQGRTDAGIPRFPVGIAIRDYE